MIKDLQNQHVEKLKASRDLMDKAESENRNLSKEEEEKYNVLIKESYELKARIDRMWSQEVLEKQAAKEIDPV